VIELRVDSGMAGTFPMMPPGGATLAMILCPTLITQL
jgi:hypothetical protein